MKITEAVFITSARTPAQYPGENLAEVAFSGRSNVGKSSVINCLVRRNKLAYTSCTPGHTRLINFYRVNHRFYFVDLPGYGYARVPAQVRWSWKRMVEEYLGNRPQLKLMLVIIDLRRGVEPEELDFLLWLKEHGIPVLLVGTKADKLKRSEQADARERIEKQVQGMGIELISFSAISKQGQNTLWNSLLHILEGKKGNG